VVKRLAEDPRLTRLTEVALALPEATRKICGSHAQFLVRKKTFAYFLDNHHGDGIVAVTCKVLSGDHQALADSQPGRFYLPAYLASKGWVSLRLDAGKVDWAEVRELLWCSYGLMPHAICRAALSIPAPQASITTLPRRGGSRQAFCECEDSSGASTSLERMRSGTGFKHVRFIIYPWMC